MNTAKYWQEKHRPGKNWEIAYFWAKTTNYSRKTWQSQTRDRQQMEVLNLFDSIKAQWCGVENIKSVPRKKQGLDA